MNSTIAILALIGWGAVVAALSLVSPYPLSDCNTFLKNFVNHEFLSFMGVVVTISLASATNLYLELNKLEERLDREVFSRSKGDARDSAYALLGGLVFALLIVILKPLVAVNAHWEAVMNGTAIGVILFAILVLFDLTQAAFSLDFRGMPDPLLKRLDQLIAAMESGRSPETVAVEEQVSGEASSENRSGTQTSTDKPGGA